MISLQTIFNQTVQHLVRQKVGAVDVESGNCRYRNDTGCGTTKCAVGYLISDAVYEKNDIEDKAVDYAGVREALFETVGSMEDGAYKLLSDLQFDHDQTIGCVRKVLNFQCDGDDPIIEWAEDTIRTAYRYNLIVPRQVYDILNEV